MPEFKELSPFVTEEITEVSRSHYVYVRKDLQVARTEQVNEDGSGCYVNIDYSEDGTLVGVEVVY